MSTEIVPRGKLTKQATTGIVSLAGAVGSFVLFGITSSWIISAIVGGAIALAGLALSSSKPDRSLGVIATVAGVGIAVLGGFFHGIFAIGGVVLAGIGVWSLFRFFRGLKTRT